jgi:hypothetical protein
MFLANPTVHNKLKPKAASIPEDVMYFAGEELGDVWVDYRRFITVSNQVYRMAFQAKPFMWLILQLGRCSTLTNTMPSAQSRRKCGRRRSNRWAGTFDEYSRATAMLPIRLVFMT